MIFERIPGLFRSAGMALALVLAVVADTGYARAQEAGVTRVVIDSRESPAFGGQVFGEVGRYEILRGRVFGEVDPEHPGNTGIVYIDSAPRNARGNVEYDVDLVIVKPIDMEQGNQTLFYGVNNRGRDPFDTDPDSDGLLMRHGFTLVWSGWHADVPESANRARFPVPKNSDGSPIRKWITNEIGIGDLGVGFPPIYTVSAVRPYLDDFYPAVEESMAGAVLLRRQGPHGQAEIIPRDQWSFANCPNGGEGTPSNKHICLPADFSAAYIYQLIYEAQDPNVQGLGFAATRDVISFLHHDASNDNPLVTDGRNPIRWTMAFGSSQSGRFLRHLLYEGFNEDMDGRIVFDGLMPHIAGGRRGFFNYEFTQTTRYSRATEEHFYPEDGFPFTYEVLTDPITGETDGLLARCRQSDTCPKIMQSDDAAEVWQGAGVTGPYGPAGEEGRAATGERSLLPPLKHTARSHFRSRKPRDVPASQESEPESGDAARPADGLACVDRGGDRATAESVSPVVGRHAGAGGRGPLSEHSGRAIHGPVQSQVHERLFGVAATARARRRVRRAGSSGG